MDSLANYGNGSDEDCEDSPKPFRMEIRAKPDLRHNSFKDTSTTSDVNYEEVGMDLSEDSNESGSNHNATSGATTNQKKSMDSCEARKNKGDASISGGASKRKDRGDDCGDSSAGRSKNRDKSGKDEAKPRENRDKQAKDDKYASTNSKSERYNSKDDKYNNKDDKYNNKDDKYNNKDDKYKNKDDRYSNNKDERYNNKDERYTNNKDDRYSSNKDERYNNKDDRYANNRSDVGNNRYGGGGGGSRDRGHQRSRSPIGGRRGRRRSNSRERGGYNKYGGGASSGFGRRFDKASNKMAYLEKMGIEIKAPENPYLLAEAQKMMEEGGNNSTSSGGAAGDGRFFMPGISGRFRDQIERRKALWQKKEPTETAPVIGGGNSAMPESYSSLNAATAAAASKTGQVWEATTFAQDQDGKQASKFKRLMGIRGAGADGASSESDIVKKQEELFHSMEQQYEVARTATHTMRGVGLGFGSFQR